MTAPSPATRFFLRDPTFAIVLAALLILGGVLSYTSMVRENNPDLAIPQATVATVWPGASPLQMEKEITKRLEDEIRALPGLNPSPQAPVTRFPWWRCSSRRRRISPSPCSTCGSKWMRRPLPFRGRRKSR